jgi:hypothetical protein
VPVAAALMEFVNDIEKDKKKTIVAEKNEQ